VVRRQGWEAMPSEIEPSSPPPPLPSRVRAVLREFAMGDKSRGVTLAIDAKHLFDFSAACERPAVGAGVARPVHCMSVPACWVGCAGHRLYGQLIRFPTEVIPIMDVVLTNLFTNIRQRERRAAGCGCPSASASPPPPRSRLPRL
jgi:hypothetical protein